MCDYFNCELCDKSIKNKSKNKHLKSECHKSLEQNIVDR